MSQRTLPPIGASFPARRTGPVVVREEESGALMVYIAYALVDAEWHHFRGMHNECVGKKDGTLKEKAVGTLRAIFPDWDGLNPFELETYPMAPASEDGSFPAEFVLADSYEDDSYIPEGKDEPIIQFKFKWLNSLEGGGGMPTPMGEDEKKKTLNKWGSRFKAISGGKAAGKQTAAAGAASTATEKSSRSPSKGSPPSRGSSGGPPGRGNASSGMARTSSQDETWKALITKNGGEKADEKATGEEFYAAWDKMYPGKQELSPSEWGKVADALGV